MSQSTRPKQEQKPIFGGSPIYEEKKRVKIKLTAKVIEVINELLKLNRKKGEQDLGKQMLKKKDILDKLYNRAFDIGIHHHL